jgi:trehalose/maltose transport system permease protein
MNLRRSAAAPGARLRRARVVSAWLFLAPALIALALVALWPLMRTFWLGLTDAELAAPSEARFVGFENYVLLLNDVDWWRSVRNTIVFASISVFIETLLGLVIALALNARFRGRGLLRAAMLIPWAMPTVVSAKLWAWMYNDVYGVINAVLIGLGLIAAPIAWTADPDYALSAIIIVDVWKSTPFMTLLILAALQMLPDEFYEAAKVDGVGPVRGFLDITLPLIRPALMVAVVFRLLDAFRVFDVVYVLTGNTPETMSMSVFARQQLVDFQDLGYGAAAATWVFFVIAMFTAAFVTLSRVQTEVTK